MIALCMIRGLKRSATKQNQHNGIIKAVDKIYRNLVHKICRLVATYFVLFGLRATFILFT